MNSGRLDATVSTNVAAKSIVNFHWNSLVKIGSSPYYFATNKSRPDILDDLNDAIYKILQSDWYYNEKVYLKYYGKTSASAAGLDNIDTYSFMKKCVTSITETEINEALIANRHVKSEQSVMQFLQNHVMMVLAVVGIILILIISFFIYYVISSRKALKLVRSNCELNEKAFVDFATGLPNKNKCEEMLSSPCALTRPTACYMLDLNDLKYVNDTYGHEMGDLMILNFAKLLRQAVPLKFFVGRFGGDEFIVIAENIRGQEEAEQLFKKIREKVFNFNSINGQFQLKYACGYAYSKEFPSCNMMELLNIADQRRYEDKKVSKSQESNL